MCAPSGGASPSPMGVNDASSTTFGGPPSPGEKAKGRAVGVLASTGGNSEFRIPYYPAVIFRLPATVSMA